MLKLHGRQKTSSVRAIQDDICSTPAHIKTDPLLSADLISDLNECRSAVDAFFSATAAYLHASDSKSLDPDNDMTHNSTIIHTLETRRDKLDREGVMLWNRSSSLRHILSDKSLDIEANRRNIDIKPANTPADLIAQSTY